jgi:hypothetical protein
VGRPGTAGHCSRPEPERTDWPPTKFKTVDALLSSYQAAERRITELAPSNADLNAALVNLQAPFVHEPQQYAPEPAYQYDQQAELLRKQQLAQQAHGPYQQPTPGLSPALQAAVTEIISSRNAANLTAQAEELVASTVHDWSKVKPQVGPDPAS